MTELQTVLIAGGSGTLGQALADDLADRGHDVVVLSRRPGRGRHRQVEWDGRTVGVWARELDEPDRTAVVNLAGRLVDVRPTTANIASLRESRVAPTRVLFEASRALDRPLARWVQASTTAIWSDTGETRVTERTPVPTGAAALPQMTGVAVPWEQAAAAAHTRHLVILRPSIVLMPDSPALDRLLSLARMFVGGRVGSGRQWFSWIHVDDWLAVVRSGLGLEPSMSVDGGVVVAASPNPVRNAELMAALRRTVHRPAAAPPTPARLVRLGAVALRTDPALALTGRHCTSDVLRYNGFRFGHPDLHEALADLLER
ncbi:MAG: NAD-dependent epimerase/dehydratase family protein [Lapillicoccus sp.]